jgi:hypothetical protein
MRRIPIAASLSLKVRFDPGWTCSRFSRMLLLLAGIEIVTMPLTQHLWTWDQFLHGGQDFELTLLMIVSCLCFVLLAAQRCRLNLRSLLSIGIFSSLMMRRPKPLWLLLSRGWPADAKPCLSAGPSEFRSLPLLI